MDSRESEKTVVNVTVNLGGVDGKAIMDSLARIEKSTSEIKITEEKVAQKLDQQLATLDSITAQVAGESTVEDGISTMLTAFIAASQNDPVKMKALADALTGNDAKLKAIADAILAGTPAQGGGGGTGSGTLTAAPTSISVGVGSTQQLAVDDASAVDVTAGSTFASDDPTIATVDGSGLVTGVATGSTNVTATQTATGATVKVPVTVA